MPDMHMDHADLLEALGAFREEKNFEEEYQRYLDELEQEERQ